MKKTNKVSRTAVSFSYECRVCVRVPLANGAGCAELYEEDYEALMTQGISHKWSLNFNGSGRRGYVKVCTSNNVRTVARLIMKAPAGRAVSYLDGNPLNLRRDNLILTQDAHASVNCADLLSQATGAAA